jgi:HlyD family secretion protein
MKKRTIYWILLFVALAGAGATYYLLTKNKKTKVEWLTDQAQTGDIRILVTATGTINAVQTVQVGTQVSGVISKILVDFNDIVRAKQIIATIDTASLYAALQGAQANVNKAKAQLLQAKNEFERNKMLWEKKVISQSDYDVAVSTYYTAQNELLAVQSDLVKAKTNLQYATIRAPINGVIISRNVDVGQTVAASFSTPTLFVIANNLKNMQLQANVDEADIGQIKIGQGVFFKVDAYPDSTFLGTVQQIRLQPNVISNVVNYSVMIDAPNPDLKLLPGMNADISIIVNEKTGVLGVPVAATRFIPAAIKADTIKMAALKITLDSLKNQGKVQVYTLDDKGNPKSIAIRKGLSDGVWVEAIGEGLTENTVVIIGIKGAGAVQKTKSLFQGPQSTRGASLRRMQQ